MVHGTRVLKFCLLTFLLLLVVVPSVVAQHGPPVDIAQRSRGSALVVVGSVASSQPVYRTNKYGDVLIVSQLAVSVQESLKGTPPGALTVEVEGGTINGITMKTSDLPELRPGDNVVLFLEPGDSGAYVPHLRGYGLLRLDQRNYVEQSSLSLDQIRTMVRGAGR
jgi:hypothetical protein